MNYLCLIKEKKSYSEKKRKRKGHFENKRPCFISFNLFTNLDIS